MNATTPRDRLPPDGSSRERGPAPHRPAGVRSTTPERPAGPVRWLGVRHRPGKETGPGRLGGAASGSGPPGTNSPPGSHLAKLVEVLPRVRHRFRQCLLATLLPVHRDERTSQTRSNFGHERMEVTIVHHPTRAQRPTRCTTTAARLRARCSAAASKLTSTRLNAASALPTGCEGTRRTATKRHRPQLSGRESYGPPPGAVRARSA